MKNRLFAGLLLCLFLRLLLSILSWIFQEPTLADFFKMSQENLKKYSLAELTGLDPIEDKEDLEYIFEKVQKNPKNYLFLNHLSQLSAIQANILSL